MGRRFLRFGRNLGEILPTSLPELPTQLMDPQILILVKLLFVNLFIFSTLLETVPSVVDHLWTQDSPIFPLIFGVKRDLISIKEGQNLSLEIIKRIQFVHDY